MWLYDVYISTTIILKQHFANHPSTCPMPFPTSQAPWRSSAPSLRDTARGSTSTWPGDPVLMLKIAIKAPKLEDQNLGKWWNMMENESPSIYGIYGIYGIDDSCRFLTQGPGVWIEQHWWPILMGGLDTMYQRTLLRQGLANFSKRFGVIRANPKL